MKERIKKLALQAGFTTNEANVSFGNYQIDKEYFYADDFIEDELKKFAELIVLEICNVLDHAQCEKSEDWVCADDTRIIEQVKDHFGIEQ